MIACCVCDNVRAVPFYVQRGPVQHRACVRCGLVRQPEPESLDTIESIYDHGYFESRGTETLAEPQARDIAVRDWLGARSGPGRRVVEIGIGWGGTLTLLQQTGAEVMGVEPSKRQATAVGEALGIDVHHGLWEDAPHEGPFDAIVLCHVLEHFRDPGEAIDKARRVLKDDGAVFIEVPNMANPAVGKVLGGWLTREHIWYFTPATLEAFLARHGFAVQRREIASYIRFLVTPAPPAAPKVPFDLPRVYAGVVRHEATMWPRRVKRRLARSTT